MVADIDATVGEQTPSFELDAGTIRQIRPLTQADLTELDAASTQRWHSRWSERVR